MNPTPRYSEDNYIAKIRKSRKYQKYFEYFILTILSTPILIFFGRIWVETKVGTSQLTFPIVLLTIGFIFGLANHITGKRRDDFHIRTYVRLKELYINKCGMPDNDQTRLHAQQTIKNSGENEIHDWLNTCDSIDKKEGRKALLRYLYAEN